MIDRNQKWTSQNTSWCRTLVDRCHNLWKICLSWLKTESSSISIFQMMLTSQRFNDFFCHVRSASGHPCPWTEQRAQCKTTCSFLQIIMASCSTTKAKGEDEHFLRHYSPAGPLVCGFVCPGLHYTELCCSLITHSVKVESFRRGVDHSLQLESVDLSQAAQTM